jgi:hypothetical protein
MKGTETHVMLLVTALLQGYLHEQQERQKTADG